MATARATHAVLSATRSRGPLAAGAVLLLHGGEADSTDRVRRTSLAAARMRPFARAIGHRAGSGGIGVFRLRNRVRGWNGENADPVDDARWALDRIEQRAGQIPVVLLGHSMGGRAALRTAAHPRVVGVVALAPWIPQGEPVEQLRGRSVLIAHGTADRVTDPALSRSYAQRASAAGLDVEYRELAGGDHAMLRSAPAWHALAAEFAVRRLLARSGDDDDEAFIA
jgi:pimeloyl-ACP methyl ester carboxylesterase